MKGSVLLGLSRFMLPIPRAIWRGQAIGEARQTAEGLSFMSADHHRVRDFVVREIPRLARPLTPSEIAGALELSQDRVTAILDELEKRLTFLFRNQEGAVTWAYPVTADRTPHRVTFGTGEQAHAA